MSKITESELSLLKNKEVFRLKSALDQKINARFKELQKEVEARIMLKGEEKMNRELPAELLVQPGRRFQGENHNGFPWRAFDYPRCSSKPDLLIFRGLFVYGQEAGFHLIATGKWQKTALSSIGNLRKLEKKNEKLGVGNSLLNSLFIDLSEDPWQWIPEKCTRVPLAEILGSSGNGVGLETSADLGKGIALRIWERHPFLKISRPIPFEEIERFPQLGAETWELLQNLFYLER